MGLSASQSRWLVCLQPRIWPVTPDRLWNLMRVVQLRLWAEPLQRPCGRPRTYCSWTFISTTTDAFQWRSIRYFWWIIKALRSGVLIVFHLPSFIPLGRTGLIHICLGRNTPWKCQDEPLSRFPSYRWWRGEWKWWWFSRSQSPFLPACVSCRDLSWRMRFKWRSCKWAWRCGTSWSFISESMSFITLDCKLMVVQATSSQC